MDILEILNSQITREVVDKVSETIANLGDGATFIASVYVKQQVITGVQCIFIATLSLIVFLVNLGIFLKKRKGEEHSWTYAEDSMVPFVIGMVSLALFGGLLSMGISHLINPEYYAIQEALMIITGGTN